MNKDFLCRQQLSLLPERIWKAVMTEASREVYRYLWDLFKAKNFDALRIMVVGAGGSYPAAISISHSLRDEMRTPYVEAVTPQTALRILTQTDRIINAEHRPKYDVVIGVSYSGTSPDIKAVYEDCREREFPFVLFTGADIETLKDEYNGFKDSYLKVVSYYNPEDKTGKENSMISMFSTLAPALIFDNYSIQINERERMNRIYKEDLEEGEKFVSSLNIARIARVLKARPVIHVLYEWRTFGLAADIASKFMESGIANVVLHEKKNFSHGEYTLLYKQKFGMVINITKFSVGVNVVSGAVSFHHTNEFDEKLNDFLKDLCKKKSAVYIETGNGMFETGEMLTKELCKYPYLITAIGEEMGIDISKPFDPEPFPPESKALYRYKGEF